MKSGTKALITVAVLAFSSAAAYANTITLTAVSGKVYQQTTQNPCIFTNPSCQQPAGFDSTALDTGGNVTGYDALSPIYTGSTLLDIIGSGNSLLIGLDINQANTAQTLSSFTMSINGTVVDTYTGTTGNVPDQNNGNGYADFVLGNFSSFTATDMIQFHFVFTDANDGTENVFLIGGPAAPVPEPISVLLTGSGLLGLVFLRRRWNAR